MNVFEKIIEKLESKIKYNELCQEEFNNSKMSLVYEVQQNAYKNAIETINKVLEEYKEKGYCWQTCACTEQCKYCRRLGNGDIDWYENIDDWTTEYNDGWIPCSKQMPEEHESIFAKLKGRDRWCTGMFEKSSDNVTVTVLYEDGEVGTTYAHTIDGKWSCELLSNKSYQVIAWQPLPEPCKPKGE